MLQHWYLRYDNHNCTGNLFSVATPYNGFVVWPSDFLLGWSDDTWPACVNWLNTERGERRSPNMFGAHSAISIWHVICLQHLATALIEQAVLLIDQAILIPKSLSGFANHDYQVQVFSQPSIEKWVCWKHLAPYVTSMITDNNGFNHGHTLSRICLTIISINSMLSDYKLNAFRLWKYWDSVTCKQRIRSSGYMMYPIIGAVL